MLRKFHSLSFYFHRKSHSILYLIPYSAAVQGFLCEWCQSILKSENKLISAFESICMFFYWSVISSQLVWYNNIRKLMKSNRIFYTAEKWRSKKFAIFIQWFETYWILSKSVEFSIFCTYIWHTKPDRTRWAIIWLKYGLLSPSISNLWQLI